MLQNLLDRLVRAGVNQIVHQLIVADPIVSEASQAGAGVHDKGEQRPSGRMQNLLRRELRGVGLVYRRHDLVQAGKALGSSVVLIDDAGGARSQTAVAAKRLAPDDTLDLRGVVI